jgi:circadian clock protein KaiC
MEVDHHFHKIEQIIEAFKPKRVVLDSLSTYGSSLGTDGRLFRDFFHALVALMKEHQLAAVYNNENPELLGMSSMMGDMRMSSLVDNIILMNWIELGDTFRLGLTVAKMRANPCVRTTRECEVINGQGMRVLDRELKLPPVSFSRYSSLLSRAPDRRERANRSEENG